MVRFQMGSGPTSSQNQRVNHITDIVNAYQSEARTLLQANGMKMLGISTAKERATQAAELMLKSGNFGQYCEIMISQGRFEDAIAYAPKVSLDYWRDCIQKYTDVITEPEERF